MWDEDDDTLEVHTKASNFSKPQAFSLDDAFSEDDSALDAADEFSPSAIRAALARTLAAGERDSAENQTGDDDEGRSAGPGVSNHNRNGSGRVEDPDASVSTLDINASPAHFPGRAPDDWSRSTSNSRGSGYGQESQDSTGMESLANFSNISLGDSVHDLEPVEVSLEPSEERMVQEGGEEEDTEDHDEVPFHAVHIDLSQGGKPRVEEITAVVSEPSDLRVPNRDGAQTPSQNTPHPPPLPSISSNNHTYNRSVSTPTSKTFTGHQGQSQSVPDLASPATDHPSVEDTHTRDESPPNSSGRVLSAGSTIPSSSATTAGSIPTQGSTVSQPHSSRSESPRRGHRPTRSVGPSTLDKVISKTRPNFLPPKPKTEDLKHMADWEAMMKQSRAVGEFHLCLPIGSCVAFCVFGEFKRIDL